VIKQASANMPLASGNFRIIAYAENEMVENPHLVLIHEDVDPAKAVCLRIHSECLTGDLLGSKRCDCGEQLTESLKLISENKGILIYLRQEGRGIGLINKLKAYNLQDKGLNTIEANIHLGFEADERHYDIAIKILNDLRIYKINLITNNPEKIEAIESSNIELVDRIPIVIDAGKDNKEYLDVKKDLMGHFLK
jgi:3,4-dihydroxy 2-butanone 4-phosphate synthase/GTP cyclohydrolase II